MKPTASIRTPARILAGSVAAILAGQIAHADGIWTGTTDGLWSTGTNWSSDPLVPGTGDTASFVSAGNGFTTIDLGGGVTVGSIIFDTVSVAAYTVGSGGAGSQTLTLDPSGAITMSASVAANQLFDASIVLGTGADAFAFANDSLTHSLTFAGGIFSTTAGAKTLTVTGAGETIIGGALTNASGSITLTKAGAGTLTLGGANTYTGATTINAGTLTVTGSLNGGALTFTGSGTFHVNEAAGAAQAMGLLTVGSGEAIVQSTYGGSGNSSLTFSDVAARAAGGGTVNFAVAGGDNGSTNRIVLTQFGGAATPAGVLLDKGVFFGGGEYAARDVAGHARGLIYGTDTNAPAAIGTGATLGIDDATKNVAIAGEITAQVTASVSTLNLGTSNFTMASGADVLSVNGLLSSGGSAATFTGGMLQPTGSGGEMVVRVNGSADQLTVGSVLRNNTSASRLTKAGAGVLVLTGASTYTGVTTVLAGTLQVGDGTAGNDGSISDGSNIVNQAALTYNLNGSTAYNGVISGPGTLTKLGPGSLTLGNSQTYSGATFISGGVLQLGAANALPTAGAVILANTPGAVLDLNGNNQTIGSLAGGGSAGGNVALNGGVLTVGDATSTTYSGIISGTGGLIKQGSGTLTLVSLESYAGPTLITGGTLKLSGAPVIRARLRPDYVANTFTNGQLASFADTTGSGTWKFYDANTENHATFNAQLTYNTANRSAHIGNSFGEQGEGGYWLPGVSSGQLISNEGSPNAAANELAIHPGPTGSAMQYLVLRWTAGSTAGGSLTTVGNVRKLNGGGDGITFSVYLNGIKIFNTVSIAGNDTVGNNFNLSGHSIAPGQSLDFVIGPTSGNFFTDNSAISATISTGFNNLLPITTPLTVSPGSTLDLSGTSQEVAALTGSGSVINSVPGGTSILTVNSTGGGSTFSGQIVGGGGNGAISLVKTGPDALTLATTNTYTGSTTVSDGLLTLGVQDAVPDNTALTMTGGTLDLGGFAKTTSAAVSFQGGVVQNGSLTKTGAAYDGRAGTVAASLQGSAGLTKTTAGTLSLTKANTYSGATTLTAGNLELGHRLAVQNSTVSVDASNALTFAAGTTGPILGGISGSGSVVLATTTAVEPVTLHTGGNDQSTAYNGTLSGSGGLTKQGSGTLTLSNMQSYAGSTIISGGTLMLQGIPTYRYYRFTPTKFKGLGGENSVQLSELQFFLNDTWSAASSVTNPGGANPGGETPPNANDNNTGTKWLDFNKGALVYDFGTPKSVDEYNWATANDAQARDPLRWRVEGSANNSTWVTLDDKTGADQSVTDSRHTWVAPGASRFTGWALAPAGGGNNLLPVTTAVSMDALTTFNLNGVNQQIASLHDEPGGPTSHVVQLGGGKLTVGDANNTTFSGAITGSGASSVEKTGSGALNLDGEQSYDSLKASEGTTNVNGVLGTAPGLAAAVVEPNARLRFGVVSQTLASLSVGAGATVIFGSGYASHQTPLAGAYFRGSLSGVWAASNGTASNWTTDGAGTGTPLTPGAATNVIFSDAGGASNLGAMSLGTNMAVNSLTVTAGETNNLHLSGAGGFTLTIGSTTNPGITISVGAGAVTLDAKIRLGADQSWTNNGASPLSIGGAVNNAGFLLTVAGTGHANISGAIGGTGGLTKSGAATLTLSGESTYSGGTVIDGGIVNVNADAALGDAAANVTVNNGATLQAAGDITATARTFILGSGGGVIDTNGSTVTLDAGSTVTGTTLTKTGTGTLTINGAQTYGALTASAGATNVNSAVAGGASVSVSNPGTTLKFGSVSQTLASLTIGAGATVTFTSGPASFAGSGGKAPGLGATAVVPEPGTLGLLLLGVLGLTSRRSRPPAMRQRASVG